jgi:hypothetical protein
MGRKFFLETNLIISLIGIFFMFLGYKMGYGKFLYLGKLGKFFLYFFRFQFLGAFLFATSEEFRRMNEVVNETPTNENNVAFIFLFLVGFVWANHLNWLFGWTNKIPNPFKWIRFKTKNEKIRDLKYKIYEEQKRQREEQEIKDLKQELKDLKNPKPKEEVKKEPEPIKEQPKEEEPIVKENRKNLNDLLKDMGY